LPEPVRILAGVGDECLATSVLEQLVGIDHVVPLTRRNRDVDGAAFRIDEGVELGRKTAARTAEGIALDPPFPPAASWCARTTELFIEAVHRLRASLLLWQNCLQASPLILGQRVSMHGEF
jgi:hypothetical protein